MTTNNYNSKKYGLMAAILVLFMAVILLVLFGPSTNVTTLLIRLAGITGIVSLFIATVMVPFQREIRKIFGKTFMDMHHYFTIAGLILVTIHPVILAIDTMDWTVFIPPLDETFWAFAGRPALIILYITLITAFLRNRTDFLQKNWKYIHWLNYVALVFGVIHYNLIGTDRFEFNPILAIIINVLLLVSFVVLVYKRYQGYQRSKKAKAHTQRRAKKKKI